ncbi:hypothetical protein B6U93_00910 [Candidatus Woesearchaeota archaeon ex4484_78]|nr:MAG: hypothetical protein B6U93_00910 [Candidatus Woesearchaeota archaeon ex4484_78]
MTNPLGISDDEYNRFIKVLIGASAAVYIIGVIGHFVFVKPSKKEGLEQIVEQREETTKEETIKRITYNGHEYILKEYNDGSRYAITKNIEKKLKKLKEIGMTDEKKLYEKLTQYKKQKAEKIKYKEETYKIINEESLKEYQKELFGPNSYKPKSKFKPIGGQQDRLKMYAKNNNRVCKPRYHIKQPRRGRF